MMMKKGRDGRTSCQTECRKAPVCSLSEMDSLRETIPYFSA